MAFREYRREVQAIAVDLIQLASDYDEMLVGGESIDQCHLAIDWLQKRIRDLDRELTTLRYTRERELREADNVKRAARTQARLAQEAKED